MSNSVRPHRQQPTRLPRPWDSPGKNTGVGCHFFLQCMKVKTESEVTQSWCYFSSVVISCLDLSNSLLTCLSLSLSPATSTLNMVADGVVLWKPRIMSLLCSKYSVLLRGKTKVSYCLQSTAVIWLLPPRLLLLSPIPVPTHHSGLPDVSSTCLLCSCLDSTCCSLLESFYLIIYLACSFSHQKCGFSQLSHFIGLSDPFI